MHSLIAQHHIKYNSSKKVTRYLFLLNVSLQTLRLPIWHFRQLVYRSTARPFKCHLGQLEMSLSLSLPLLGHWPIWSVWVCCILFKIAQITHLNVLTQASLYLQISCPQARSVECQDKAPSMGWPSSLVRLDGPPAFLPPGWQSPWHLLLALLTTSWNASPIPHLCTTGCALSADAKQRMSNGELQLLQRIWSNGTQSKGFFAELQSFGIGFLKILLLNKRAINHVCTLK